MPGTHVLKLLHNLLDQSHLLQISFSRLFCWMIVHRRNTNNENITMETAFPWTIYKCGPNMTQIRHILNHLHKPLYHAALQRLKQTYYYDLTQNQNKWHKKV